MQTIPINWPQNLTLLNLQVTQKDSLRNFLTTFIPNYLRTGTPINPPSFQAFEYDNRTWTIDLDFHFLYDAVGKIKHVILHLKGEQFELGKGANRTVRRCYDLVKGRFRAEKKIELKEKEVLEKLNGSPGFPKIYGFYTASDNTLFSVEKIYGFTLQNLIHVKSYSPKPILTRVKLMQQLAEGLSILHEMRFQQNNIGFSYMHFDIKAANILIDLNKNKAVLTDFEYLNCLDKFCCSPSSLSPEYYELLKSDYTKKMLLDLNHKWGTARDVWALGLCFIYLFTNREFPTHLGSFPTFECLFYALGDAYDQKKKKLDYLKVVFREDIRQKDLATLKMPFQGRHFESAIVDLIGRMVSIQPENRPNAKECADELTELINEQ